jgi:hypothetical protein
MLFNSGSVILNGFGSGKKRKRIDVLFSMLNEVRKIVKMERNKIYNIFNQKNLKHLIRRTSRRKKKNERTLYLKEVDMDLYLEKVSQNWKTRRMKPPDKVVEIIITSLCIKEYYKKKKEMKEREQMTKKKEKSSKQVLKKKLSDVSKIVKKVSSERKVMEQEHRTSLAENDYLIALDVPKVNIVHENLRSTSTKSERRCTNCRVLRTEDIRRSHGQGYSIYFLKITINALWKRIVGVYILHRL